MSTRVLIADPDESLLCSYRSALSRTGFQVATASNGLECVAILRSFVPDVLVLELDMPWGGGVGVLAMMHDGDDLPQVPVIVLTGPRGLRNLDDVLLFAALSAYHVKPLAPEQLARLIRRMLEDPVPSVPFEYWGSPAHRPTYPESQHTPKSPATAALASSAAG